MFGIFWYSVLCNCNRIDMTGENIFVFGSNLSGRHGRGAALYARKHYGAKYGEGVGRTGNSYAIPTKNRKLETLPLKAIKDFVNDFIRYAGEHQELKFNVTRIGCGLAGYKDEDIAPMFKDVPPNCILPAAWKIII